MESTLQFMGNAAIGVLAFITLYLSRPKNIHHFIIVGQSIFKWLFAVLTVIFVTRLLIICHILNQTNSRYVNSVVFVSCVLGILWSVRRRHGTQ